MPASVTTGPIAELQYLLAHCAAFQDWVNVSSSEDALDRIHIERASANATRPFAVIQQDQEQRRETYSGGSRFYRLLNGTFTVIFEANVSSDYVDSSYQISDADGAIAELSNPIAAIKDDMNQLGGAAGYLMITDIRQPSGVEFSDEDETPGEVPFAQVTLEVDYGLTPG